MYFAVILEEIADLQRIENQPVDTMKLCDICCPRLYTRESCKEPIRIIHFPLSEMVQSILEPLSKLHCYKLFADFWTDHLSADNLSLDEIVANVWEPSVTYCKDLCKRIRNGNVKLCEVEKILERFGTSDLMREVEEISKVTIPGEMSWIQKQFEKFTIYKQMTRTMNVAKEIVTVKDVFELQGDFTPVEKLLVSKHSTFDESTVSILMIMKFMVYIL